jgi:ATP-dependent protease HslVU (ClpYQ) peptidase subunit
VTTIVASKGIMVADSKVSIGSGLSYPAIKIIKINGFLAGACGDGGDCSRFLEWAKEEFKPKSKPKFNFVQGDNQIDCLVVKKDGIYFYAPSYPDLEKIEAEFYAIGSGSKAARAAMIMGADPIKAVEVAIAVDDYSGLPLQILEI